MIDKLFDKKYIEMCVLNPDLQNMWDFQLYSYYWDTRHEKIYCLIETNLIKKPNYLFWIPTQTQLQIILKEKVERFRDMTELKFDFNMRQCIFGLYCHKILVMLSLNNMWLIFFMKSLFGKQWVPERKAWEPR